MLLSYTRLNPAPTTPAPNNTVTVTHRSALETKRKIIVLLILFYTAGGTDMQETLFSGDFTMWTSGSIYLKR